MYLKSNIKDYYDVVVIGAGPAGMAACISAAESGLSIALIERNEDLGGILNQCIHDGFGLHYFKKQLTGPEYAYILAQKIRSFPNVDIITQTMVVDVKVVNDIKNDLKSLTVSSYGIRKEVKAKAVVLATGCRERTRMNLRIPGTRPAGVFTAGVAQNYINLQNLMIGDRAVILGSGDVGLIMARRLTLEGAKVLAVVEKLPYPSGLPRNIAQCLKDFDIPLYLSHTITEIYGKKRIERVKISKVDEKTGKTIDKESFFIDCDTLLISAGLIPENELAQKIGITIDPKTGGPVVNGCYMTNINGVFACGNCLHVHDLADWASWEGEYVGKVVASYIKDGIKETAFCKVLHEDSIRYVIPQYPLTTRKQTLFMRVRYPLKHKSVVVEDQARNILTKKHFLKLNPAEMISILVDVPIDTEFIRVKIV